MIQRNRQFFFQGMLTHHQTQCTVIFAFDFMHKQNSGQRFHQFFRYQFRGENLLVNHCHILIYSSRTNLLFHKFFHHFQIVRIIVFPGRFILNDCPKKHGLRMISQMVVVLKIENRRFWYSL